MKKSFFLFFLIFLPLAFAQQTRGIVERPEMQVLSSDIALSERISSDGQLEGIDLYIRKKDEIESVMLVETAKDPEGKEDNYAYRAGEWNEVNGDEIRYLNNQELHSEYAKYSLISSTVTSHPELGECFHIYIPNTLYYGYPWSRNGSVKIGKGVFINIRTFEKPYGDYTGRYMDNSFMFDFGKKQKKETKAEKEIPVIEEEPIKEEEIKEEEIENVILTDDYSPLAAESFSDIAKEGNGEMIYSRTENLAEDLIALIAQINPDEKTDVVFAIDTTGSMKDDMDSLRKEWVPRFIEQIEEYSDIRIGFLFYRDYNDTYNYKGLPVKFYDFTDKSDVFVKELNSVVIHGNEGGDIPEAVYEALYSSINFYNWRKDAIKRVILIGDAEPHSKPRGSKKITKEIVFSNAKEKEIRIDCIIVPDEKADSSPQN